MKLSKRDLLTGHNLKGQLKEKLRSMMILLILQTDFAPNEEEPLTLEKEVDPVKPYNYTYQNSTLMKLSNTIPKAISDQLERAKEVKDNV
ncbi:hypothetical protein Tco_0804254 [Tanacetum coccineum]|uniref:Uncharacterized protein n=1 Tax=Tanacetum coccineum TaxID=301880 RepID=A0ABQ5A6E4_9ASTR